MLFRHSEYFLWVHGKLIWKGKGKGKGKWSYPSLRSQWSYGSEVMDSLASKLDGYPIVREVSLDMTIFHYPLGIGVHALAKS